MARNMTYVPELKPPASGEHGVANVPWVAVWPEGRNWNVIVSPATAPVTWSGENLWPLCPAGASTPAWTTKSVAQDVEKSAEAKKRRIVEGNIL
jgi:hypothetical protein